MCKRFEPSWGFHRADDTALRPEESEFRQKLQNAVNRKNQCEYWVKIPPIVAAFAVMALSVIKTAVNNSTRPLSFDQEAAFTGMLGIIPMVALLTTIIGKIIFEGNQNKAIRQIRIGVNNNYFARPPWYTVPANNEAKKELREIIQSRLGVNNKIRP